MNVGSVALVLALLTGAPPGDEPAIRVTRAGDARIAVLPGSINTIAFRLANTELERTRAVMSTSLPRGWTLISSAANIDLPSGATELQLVSFGIPRNARPGRYTVRYAASGSGGFPVSDADSVLVEVGRRPAVDVQFMAAPAIVRGGTAFSVTFALVNQGNTPLSLALRATASPGLNARPDFTGTTLEPDQTLQVTVRVTTPMRVPNELHARVSLVATDQARAVDVNATSTMVRVLPTTSERMGDTGQFPLHLAARLNSSEQVAPSVELAGAGILVAGTDLHGEVVARTATRANGFLEDRDQLSVSVGNRRFDARVGDHFVALTPLTELGRPGFGATINLNAGPLILGALAAHDRRGNSPDVYGGKLGVQLGSTASITANYIAKSASDTAQLISGRALFAPTRWAQGEIEFAANASGPNANAHSLRLGGATRFASYDVRTLRSAPAFRGYTGGVSSDAAVLRLHPIRRIEVGGAVARVERADPRSTQTPHVDTYRAFTNFGRLLGLDVERRDWIQSSGKLSTRTETLRARSTVQTGFVMWQPSIEAVTVANRVTSTAVANLRYTLRTAVNVARQSVSVAVMRVAADRPEYVSSSEAITATLQPVNGTRIDLDFQQDRYAHAWRTTLLNATVAQRVYGDHYIAARTRLVAFNNRFVREQSVVTLEYVLPINVTVPRSRLTRVQGVVVDASNRPVRDVLIRLHDRVAVTGANGRFSFRDVEPQSHYLQIELAAAGRNLTTITPNPLLIDASNGPLREIRIGLTQAARVHGSVRLQGIDKAADAAAIVRSAIIELSQGPDTHRRPVDAAGHFSFEGLRPGTWQLRIVNELPMDYTLAENAVRKVEVSAGDSREVTLELLTKIRPLKLLEEKSLPTLQSQKR